MKDSSAVVLSVRPADTRFLAHAVQELYKNLSDISKFLRLILASFVFVAEYKSERFTFAHIIVKINVTFLWSTVYFIF